MQSYLNYKEYYDRKAKAAPLRQNDFCFILQPIANHQGSKIPFREDRWTGPYIVEKVLPNKNFIVRKLNSNKTQILHRIRLRKYEPNTVLQDIRPVGNLQPDDEIIIPQDDLYVITWETNFGEFPNSTEENSIPTRREALDTSNDYINETERRTKFSPTWTLGPPGLKKMTPKRQTRFPPTWTLGPLTWTLGPPSLTKMMTLFRLKKPAQKA